MARNSTGKAAKPQAPLGIREGRVARAGTPLRFIGSPYAAGSFGRGEPSLLVMHYTCGGSALSTANWFRSPANPGTSAHLVIDRDGSIIQCVDLDRIAWHAGQSHWKGRRDLNRYAIGIELANWGALQHAGAGWASFTGQRIARPVLAAHRNGNPDGSRIAIGWEPFPEEQIDAAAMAARAIIAAIPTIREIVGHDDIAPGRKHDPGPAFDLTGFRRLVLEAGA